MPEPNVFSVTPAGSGGDNSSEDTLTALRRETENYLETVRELERKRKPGEGIFGMKGGPADNPCHDRYSVTVNSLLTAFAEQEPASEEVRRVLEEIYTAPKKQRNPACAYWMLIAVQRHTLPLIDRLSREDAGAVYERFVRDTPRHERLPVQREILKKLIQR